MKRIAVLNDLSGLGKCSLTAAIPVISVMGVQACPLPTAVLSNQTGYASYYCDDFTDRMDAYEAEWKKRGFLPDGIYTGFTSGEEQAGKILKFIREFSGENTLLLTDPVMGDQGRTYKFYSEGLCRNMRLLAKEAQVTTPNLTEALLLLYGKEEMERRWEVLRSLPEKECREEINLLGDALIRQFSLRAAVITGVDVERTGGSHLIGNLVCEDGKMSWIFSEKTGGSYSGTGDLFASVLSAGLVRGMHMEECVKKAVDFLSKGIRDAVQEGTDRNDGICFETYLHELATD